MIAFRFVPGTFRTGSQYLRQCVFPAGTSLLWIAWGMFFPGGMAIGQPALGPQRVASSPENEASIVRLPDGTLKVLWIAEGKHCLSIASRDHGRSWSTPRVEFPVPNDSAPTTRTLVDRSGRLHVCFLVCRGRGNRRHGVDLFYDIWHTRTDPQRRRWSPPRRIWAGYVGALREMVQLRQGRILLPVGKWVRPHTSPTGSNEVRVLWTDDEGLRWHESPVALTVPVQPHGGRIGAVEPTLVQLRSGKLWMLIRNDSGWLYQSFSQAGIRWTRPEPSRFPASESPAKLLRLPRGGILLLWNNCQELLPPPGKNFPAYSGRDALHAALSLDEGRTWHGFREVFLDPLRDQTPPQYGDRGTAYPDAVVAEDGTVVLVTGQGRGRRSILRFDPRWLLQTEQEEDFARGLRRWSVFRPFGPLKFVWRDRKPGARLVPHPDLPDRKALHLRCEPEHLPDGAVWNFPLGRRGTLRVQLRLNPGCRGGSIALADRFFDPCDDQGERRAVFLLRFAPPGKAAVVNLPPKKWHLLALHWDLHQRRCRVEVDGRPAATLPLQTPTPNGVCYLRLRAADGADPGWLVDQVQVKLHLPGSLSNLPFCPF